ncbi:flagellar hook assembly protein FlgD [Salipiger bermudensis]|uniref:flagellar hook assembly protein FlgD n=1 Tax=Salipiger bermudensis TaxID=344736 RepID=UPI001C9936C9|nr:flagellar hook capping FlgD N-terminal domain-containing protein [Salipiger bermudensis]MBY6006468.1 flagellar hook assembly protein FlgD [Salipiger bermudensis]
MAIDPFGTGSVTGASTTASSSMSQLSEDYESFITLLTAQIQNQNPLEPMDSTTFISQLAQLSQVEQSVAVNDNLEGISNQLSSMSAITGLNLIGRSVVAPTERISLNEAGAAVAGYRLAGEASAVSMSIVSADGTVLRSYSGLEGGSDALHGVTWDGMDYEGLPLPEGTYYMVLSATDAQGNTVPGQTYAASRVNSMTYEDGLAMLHMENGESTLAGLIEEIR